MKTSVIEVRDMLSVLTIDEVEKRFVDMAGVESATVNYDAKNVTVRYDETLLEVADIKVLMHQRGQQSTNESPAKDRREEKPEPKPTANPTASATANPAASAAASPTASPPSRPPASPGATPTPQAAPAAATETKPPQAVPAKVPASTAPAGSGKAAQAPASNAVSANPTAATNVSSPSQAAASAMQHKNHEEPNNAPDKESGTLGKLTAWVQDAFSGADDAPAKPDAKAESPAATGAKTALGAPM